MSKERARRRAEREKEAAVVAAARAARAERRDRQRARQQVLSSRLPRRRPRPTGVLAERRRRQTATTVALVAAFDLLVLVNVDDRGLRAMVLTVSLLAVPVLHTMLFRR